VDGGVWKKLHNESLINFTLRQIHEDDNTNETDRVVARCIRVHWGPGAYKISSGKTQEKKQLVRLILRCQDNIEIDFKKIGYDVWTRIIWLKIGTITYLRVPLRAWETLHQLSDCKLLKNNSFP
jgi:hypothetical protein